MIARPVLFSVIAAAVGVAGAAGGVAGAAAEDRLSGVAAIDKTLPIDQPQCFMRVYDAAHLKANPKQTVTFMSFRRGFGELAVEKARREIAIKDGPQSDRYVEVTLRVAFRDTGVKRWDGSATCDWQDGRILCESGNCEGGRFELRSPSRDEILVVIQETPDRKGSFSLGDSCGNDGEGRNVGLSVEDGVFKLKRAPLAQCR